MPTGIAIVGCGFVADYYMSCLRLHPELRVVAVFDRDAQRGRAFAAHHGVRQFPTLQAAVEEERAPILVNLSSVESHVEVTALALRAGRHVYSEKPLALSLEEATELVCGARRAGTRLSASPCCPLSESAQTMWRAVRKGAVGRVRGAYAEVDIGPLHRMPHGRWRSVSGAPWPFAEEKRLGCILEHAPYAVSRLASMFGPVLQVASFAARVVDGGEVTGDGGADLGVACLSFEGGIVARVTCGAVGPYDRSLRVFGDEGVLTIPDFADDRSPVSLRRYVRLRRRTLLSPWRHRYRLARSGEGRARYRGAQRRDFARGIADLAAAILERREPRLSEDFCLHVTEVVLAMSGAGGTGSTRMRTTFGPPAPMPWAADGV
jgi:predicted dehydrogenase